MDLSQAKPIVTPAPAAPAASAPTPEPVQQPTQTPVAEPSTPVETTAPVATDPTPAPVTLETPTTFEETGNAAFDSIGSILKGKGVKGIDAAFEQIAETGEVPLAFQAKILEAVGEDMAPLVFQQLQTEINTLRTERSQAQQATLDYAAKAFGVETASQEMWSEIQQFVRSPESGFTDADKRAMTDMLQAGGMQAELVIDRVHKRFQETQGVQQEADLLAGDTYSPATFKPLSKQEYSEQIAQVVSKYGYDSHQAETLRKQRAASMQRGY